MMEPNASDQQLRQEQIERMIENLPEEIQSLCASGKSVIELSHLIKNILQMVSGSAEIIQLGLERKQYDRVASSWTIFEPNFLRLKRLLLQLIKYTKQYPLHTSECDFNQGVRKGIEACQSVLKGRPAKLQLRLGSNIPLVLLDTERVEEMAANLVINAVDNLGQQGGNIVVKTDYLEADKEIEFSVCDNGTSLSVEAIRALRQPSERAASMCGTGFDIPLAGLYAQQHGGYLEIDSTPPNGNLVHIYLPAHTKA